MYIRWGERVRLGLELKLRLLWRKNKNMIKADQYAKHTSPDEAKNHPPSPRVWGDRTEDDWNQLVDWWSQPDRKVQKGHYEDLIETWRKTHSRPETREFKTEKNRKRYVIGYEEHARSG
ncbi:hypothetical protein Tco_0745398 [Tanacetum coccineum]